MRTIREQSDGLIRANAPVLVLVALALQVACSGEVLARGPHIPTTHERNVLKRVGEAVSRAVRRMAAPTEARPERRADAQPFVGPVPVSPVPMQRTAVRADALRVAQLINLPPPALA